MKQLKIIFPEDIKAGIHVLDHEGIEYSIHKVLEDGNYLAFKKDRDLNNNPYLHKLVYIEPDNYSGDRQTVNLKYEDIREIKYCEVYNKICSFKEKSPDNYYFNDCCIRICAFNDSIELINNNEHIFRTDVNSYQISTGEAINQWINGGSTTALNINRNRRRYG